MKRFENLNRVKIKSIPARKRKDETDASLCVQEGTDLRIVVVHAGNADDSNAICNEIERRWNGFEEWHDVNEVLPPFGRFVNVRLKDGRYSNSWFMSDGFWAFNLEPTHWCEIEGEPITPELFIFKKKENE